MEVLKAFFGLINKPLIIYFQSFGWNAELINLITITIDAIVGGIIIWFWRKLAKICKSNRSARKFVQRHFEKEKIKQIRKLFIPTQWQNLTPSIEDEPKAGTSRIAKNPLIQFLLKSGFNENVDDNRFNIVLADSGMGKTTFMVSLFLKNYSCINLFHKYKMKLFHFGDSSILQYIKEIKPEEAHETILLLDAFDESKALQAEKGAESDGLTDDERFKKYLDKVIEHVKGFREVVISSRSQYFPGQDKEDYVLKVPRYSGEGFHELIKYYISPFDRKEIRRYLNKKYGILRFWNRVKKQEAESIVYRSPKLMVRPMLLSYIDLLVDDQEHKFKHTFEIYETLIEKWIAREAEKRKSDHIERERFKKALHEFSRLVALEIYNNQMENNLLTKEDAQRICEKYKIDLHGYEATGQSLLTRDASQNWKFAHKSFLEYFLAKECDCNIDFALRFNFMGMDMAEHFYKEMNPFFSATDFVKVQGGTFLMGSSKSNNDAFESEYPQHEVTIADFYVGITQITQKQWRDVMGNNPSHFNDSDDCPVETVSWDDVQNYIDKLKVKTGKLFRLPTEAEWEHAARGGQKSQGFMFAGSNNLDEVGWYLSNSGGKTQPVATKNPNELGLYDMSGNVYEWCQDKWHENYEGAPTDGSAWDSGGSSGRVLRGGYWGGSARGCRSAYRSSGAPAGRCSRIGFRLVFVPQGW